MFVLCSKALAQTTPYVKANVGGYVMSDFKALLSDFESQIISSGINAKVTNSFPASVQAEAGLLFTMNSLRVGPYLNYCFSKGLIDYEDYSGSLNVEEHVSRILIGARGYKHLGSNLFLGAQVGVGFSSLKINSQSIVVNGSQSQSSIDFKSLGISGQPDFMWCKRISKLEIQINIGYEFKIFQGETGSTSNSNAYLIGPNKEKLFFDWSGLRVGLGMGLIIQ